MSGQRVGAWSYGDDDDDGQENCERAQAERVKLAKGKDERDDKKRQSSNGLVSW